MLSRSSLLTRSATRASARSFTRSSAPAMKPRQPAGVITRSFATQSGKAAYKAIQPQAAGMTGWGTLAVLSGVVVGTQLWNGNESASADEEWKKIREELVDAMESQPDYDDGSYGPILVRLAWHSSGTFDKHSGTGGSNGATMRFSPEKDDGANAGLAVARNLLEPIKRRHPNISYADLWTFAGKVAIEEMGGPEIPWRSGRSDAPCEKCCPPTGRLPDASKSHGHLRDVFYRMGFNDRDIVALSGAHALGRCHTDRSGFKGPWTRAPTMFTNEYFRELVENKWTKKKWTGPEQYEDPTGELMMLPTDMSLLWDPEFRKYVEIYAKDEERFFQDFSRAFSKLMELGVKF